MPRALRAACGIHPQEGLAVQAWPPTILAVATLTGPPMPARILVRVLAAVLALATGIPARTAPLPKPAPSDLAALEKSLPEPGHDRVFLALPGELEGRLGIDPAVVRAVDPGVACDPDAHALSMSEGDLGTAGHVQTSCTPDRRSQSLLTLADGSAWITVCGAALGAHVTASIDVQVGDKSLHASTEPPAAKPAPAHDCSGWRKIPH